MEYRGKIEKVEPGSVAGRYGLIAGDKILSINGHPVNDTLDYMFRSCVGKLNLEILRGQEKLKITIKKNADDPLGIIFNDIIFDKIKICRNRCKFCFVEQGPPGARDTMKIKDDDFRLSFMCGNFISLTNLTEDDWKKIAEYRLSPLYVSVHTTNPQLRSEIFGNDKAQEIMEQLEKLISMGITVHTQIVLSPGINDGEELDRTLNDLAGLYPGIGSVAAVPVGITKYHKKGQRVFTEKEMKNIIALVCALQKKYKKITGDSFIFLSDELYIKTGTQLPSYKSYGDFPQIENGIGMMRNFLTAYNRSRRFLPAKLTSTREVSVVTGVLAGGYMGQIVERFSNIGNLKIKLHIAKNHFWGENVDVAGLLTGLDIQKALESKDKFTKVLIPAHCLRDNIYFLDGKSIEDIENATGCEITAVEPNFKSLSKAILKG